MEPFLLLNKIMWSFVFIFIMTVSPVTHAGLFCADLFSEKNLSQNEILRTTIPTEKIKDYLKAHESFFEHGKYKNQEVDQTKFRPIERIPEFETADHFYATQFYHQGKFWMARIPKSAVRDVIFQLALFKGPLGKTLAHAQLRFITSETVVLFRLKNGQVVYNETRDFIFTIQAAFPKGQKYDATQAALGHYLVVSRMVNTFDRAYSEEILDNDQVTQYRMKNLSAEQKNNLLMNSIDFSTERLLGTRYRAAIANCTNLLFDIIDKTLNITQPRVELTFWNFFKNGKSPNEKMALDALRNRNLIDDSSAMPDYTRAHKP